jgi:hypothetical protein
LLAVDEEACENSWNSLPICSAVIPMPVSVTAMTHSRSLYLGFRSVQVPFTSAIVPGQIFPINISQKIHTVLFGINLRFGGGNGF